MNSITGPLASISIGTWGFAGFLVAAVGLYWAVPKRFRVGVLLVSSYVFYAWAFPLHALVLFALTVAAWLIAGAIPSSTHPKRWLAAGIVLILATLAGFKYTGMAVVTLDFLFVRIGVQRLPIPQIAAPLGLSYVSFMLINALVEVYRGGTDRLGFGAFAAYAAFFPTVTSGPIKRYAEWVVDLRAGTDRPRGEDLAYGAFRILVGVAKKFVIADTLVPLIAPLSLAEATSKDPALLLLAVYAYALRLYFDFAGYSDIAVGASRLFGFRIMENFSWPYLRRNLAEFWRSWHISLTRLITEYVYIPLGGSRSGAWMTARNTLIAFAVSGLWHGAAWHFVVWGLYHGVGLVVVRIWRTFSARLTHEVQWIRAVSHNRVGRAIGYGMGVLVTFNYVAFGWVLFAAPLSRALVIYERLFGGLLVIAGRVM